jgi:hypothetical protein
MSKCNIDMRIQHSSDIGIADFRLPDVHGSDYPLFEYCSWNRNNTKIANARNREAARSNKEFIFFFASSR